MRICTVCEKQYDDSVTMCPDDGAQTAAEGAQRVEEVDPLIGRMIGSYKIYKLLGKGGMGAVYAAEHPAIGSKVAIKFLHEQYAKDKGIVTRFFNEAKAVNVINHDNIVKVSDYAYLDEKMPYFVMEMLGKGYELGKLAKSPLPLSVAGPILLQVCDALAAAHANSIVHRDLKPDNIFLAERSGRKHFVKLMDFGIAKLAGQGESQGQTQTGMVMGTPHYMSPEQASGKTSSIDGRSDIYSLGIIMYQLATGRVPFKGESFAETLVAHIAQPPQPPRELVADVPERYEQVILKAIAKKPEDRYQNTRELQNDIAEVMKENGCSFELPLADGAALEQGGQTGGSTVAITGATVAITGPGTKTGPGQQTRVQSGTMVGGTAVLSPEQAAKMHKGLSAGARAVVWISCLAVGFGAVVGLRKAGALGKEGDAAVVRLAQAKARAEAARAELARQQQAPAGGTQTAAATGTAQAQTAMAASKVRITLASTPAGADVTVDGSGQQVGKTPVTVELPRGASVGFIFTAPGGQPHKQTVVADSEKTVTAQLEGAAPAPTPAPQQ